MILVDTSVWVDHLRHTERGLVNLLNDGLVLTHNLVIQELACGNLSRREDFLELIASLPTAPVATHYEVLDLISSEKLYGTGLGSVDVHLIASARLGQGVIWSKDKVLAREASRLDLCM